MNVKGSYFNSVSNKWEIDFYNIYNLSLIYPDVIIDHLIPKIKKYDVRLDGIGNSMKLKPYIYQKESIQFILDKKNALLILPCGAGK